MPKVSQHKRRVIPEMSTTTHAHPGLTTAQETVQVVLLIIFSVVGTWIALIRVPWQLSADPCLVAAAATGVIKFCWAVDGSAFCSGAQKRCPYGRLAAPA